MSSLSKRTVITYTMLNFCHIYMGVIITVEIRILEIRNDEIGNDFIISPHGGV